MTERHGPSASPVYCWLQAESGPMTQGRRFSDALDYHGSGRPGKIEVVPTKPPVTQRDLSLAYSPGVAEPCLEIAADPEMPSDTRRAATWSRSSPTAPRCWAWATSARWPASR